VGWLSGWKEGCCHCGSCSPCGALLLTCSS
jgi:hypothetical protein